MTSDDDKDVRLHYNCTAPYRLISRDDLNGDWVFGIDPSKSCPFSIVHVSEHDPIDPDSWRYVESYTSEEKMKDPANPTVWSCEMMPRPFIEKLLRRRR